MTEERMIATPGEVVETSGDFLPGEGTRKDEKGIIAERYGLVDKSDRLVKIIPLSGVFIPRRGNTVIGEVIDVNMSGWSIDVDAANSAFLPLAECEMFVKREEMREYLDIGDMVAVKIFGTKGRSMDLSEKGRGLGKLSGGITIKINPQKVPRVIGKEGSMINMIKDATKCDIVVGQNGLVWIKGDNVEDEISSRKAIEYVTEKSYMHGLTDMLSKWLEDQKK